MARFASPDVYTNSGSGPGQNPNTGTGLETLRENQAALLQLPGAQPPETLVISSGSIAPSRAWVIVDTEGGEAGDELTAIALDEMVDGAVLRLTSADALRVVTLQNNSSPSGIVTLDGQDLVLDRQWPVVLTKRNGRWEEVPGPLRARQAADDAAEAAADADRKATRGVARWSADADYLLPSLVYGQDLRLYAATAASGPSSPSGARDPESGEDFWTHLLRMAPSPFTSRTLLAQFTVAGSYSWTVPDANRGRPFSLLVMVKGGGGGGGCGYANAQNQVFGSNGGGEGATLLAWFDVHPQAALKVGSVVGLDVGAPGAGGTTSGAYGASGGTSLLSIAEGLWGASGGGGGICGTMTGGYGGLHGSGLTFGDNWMIVPGRDAEPALYTYLYMANARSGAGRYGGLGATYTSFAQAGLEGCGGGGGHMDSNLAAPGAAGGAGMIRIFMTGDN